MAGGRFLRAMATEGTTSDELVTNTRWKSTTSWNLLQTTPVDKPAQLAPLEGQMIAKSHLPPPLRVI